MPVDSGGCGNLRVRQPLQLIKEYTEHDTHVVDLKEDNSVAISQAMLAADVVLFRQGGEAGIRKLREIPEYAHLKYVLDIDDNIELISPYSEHYKEYGTAEFKDIWVDGKAGFDLTRNRQRVASLLQGLREADLVTVTTEKLGEYARQYNQSVAVLPNALDLRHWYPLRLKPNKRLRVGWSGGVSHYEDWYSIKAPLNALLKRYQFTLVSAGAHFAGVIDPENRHLVEVLPWVPFSAHSYRMMTLALDAAIIPLADLPFNHYKSAIKLAEMSAMGVPSVVARVGPYKAEKTYPGPFYTSPETFFYQLETLLTEPKKRRELGGKVRHWAEAKHDQTKQLDRWVSAYASLIDKT